MDNINLLLAGLYIIAALISLGIIYQKKIRLNQKNGFQLVIGVPTFVSGLFFWGLLLVTLLDSYNITNFFIQEEIKLLNEIAGAVFIGGFAMIIIGFLQVRDAFKKPRTKKPQLASKSILETKKQIVMGHTAIVDKKVEQGWVHALEPFWKAQKELQDISMRAKGYRKIKEENKKR